LEMADFVKFAKVRPLPDDNIAAMNQAVKFIDDTRPAPEPETPAENVADATTAKSSDNSPKAPKS
ncbi:MAG: hypothetical protein K1V71_05015, partial [Paramuribaculum sp.]